MRKSQAAVKLLRLGGAAVVAATVLGAFAPGVHAKDYGKPGQPVHLVIGYQPYYTQAWSGEYSFKPAKGLIYEYACHEGNYSMEGILRGAGQAGALGGAGEPAAAARRGWSDRAAGGVALSDDPIAASRVPSRHR